MIRATSLGRRQAPTRWCGALLIAPLIATLVSAAVSAALGAVRHPALGRVVMLGPPNQGSEVVDRDDGKVSVAGTRVEGMADFISVAASHPLLVRDADAIRQTLAFLEDGKFVHDAAPAAPPSGGALTAR